MGKCLMDLLDCCVNGIQSYLIVLIELYHFGVYSKIGQFVFFYVHKWLNLGFMYVVFFVHQGINFQTLVCTFLCMNLQIHHLVTIVKCCLGPLLPNKKLHRNDPKYLFQNVTSQNLDVLPLILKHLISQRHFTFLKFQNTRFMLNIWS